MGQLNIDLLSSKMSDSGSTLTKSPATTARFEQRACDGDDSPILSPASMMAKGDDVLRVIPVGTPTRTAFHELAQM